MSAQSWFWPSISVGFASVPVASAHVWPLSIERQKPTVDAPLSTEPAHAYTAVCAGSALRPAASVTRPASAGTFARLHVAPSAEYQISARLPPVHAVGSAATPNTPG